MHRPAGAAAEKARISVVVSSVRACVRCGAAHIAGERGEGRGGEGLG